MALSYDVRSSNGELEEYMKRGSSLTKRGKHDEAKRLFDAASRMAAAYVKSVTAPVDSDDLETVQMCDEAININDKIYDMFRRQSDLFDKLEMYREAKKFYNKAFRIRAASYPVHLGRGAALNGLERYKEAEECLDRALKVGWSPEVFNHMGMALRGLGRYAEALEYVKSAVFMKSMYAEATYNKALLLDETGAHCLAVYCFDELLRTWPDFDGATLSKGAALAHAGEHKDAIVCFDESLRIKPGMPKALYLKAHSLYRMGMYGEAIACYDKLLGARSDFLDAALRRDEMLKLQDGPPKRMWLPMLILERMGGLQDASRLQIMAFLVQRGLGRDDYDFGSLGFGPYSDELRQDVSSNTDLIAGISFRDEDAFGYCHKSTLTVRGRKILRNLGRDVSRDIVRTAAKHIDRYMGVPLEQALDDVYSEFTPARVVPGKGTIARDMKTVASSIACDGCDTWSHLTVAATIEHMGAVFSNLGKAGNALQKNVILHILKVMIYRCGGIGKHLDPPIDSDLSGPTLAELRGYDRLLLQYCDTKGIMKDPRTVPLEEMLTVDEARRLAKGMSQIELST